MPDRTRVEREQVRLDRLKRFANLMDSRFQVPGTGIRFGLDPLLGLIPGIGDGATALASFWIVYQARELGASIGLVARMLGNIAVDFVVGAVPLLGDLFDVRFKANRRNVALLEESLLRRKGEKKETQGFIS